MTKPTEPHPTGKDAPHPNPFLRIDGTTWPDPSDPTDVQWRLRYGTPSKEDLLVAASVMNAYHALIAVPQGTRNLRVRQIRQALDTRVTPPASTQEDAR